MIFQALAQAAQAVIEKVRQQIAERGVGSVGLVRSPLHQLVFIVINISLLAAVEAAQVAVGVVGGDDSGVRYPGQFIFAVHRKPSGDPIAGSRAEIPGGVIDIAAILGIDRAVGVGQLRNIVVIIIHVAAAAGEGLVCPLAAVIV